MANIGGDAWNAVQDFEESGKIPSAHKLTFIRMEAERLEETARRYRRVLDEVAHHDESRELCHREKTVESYEDDE